MIGFAISDQKLHDLLMAFARRDGLPTLTDAEIEELKCVCNHHEVLLGLVEPDKVGFNEVEPVSMPTASAEREALMRIVRVSIQVMEGCAGHPVVYQNEACLIATEALKLTRDELLAIGQEVCNSQAYIQR